MFIWVGLGVVLFLVATCEVYAIKTGVPTVTSWPSVRKKMIELLRDESAARQKPLAILDLGSGTGKLDLEIGRALPDAHVTGVEISIAPYVLSHLRRLLWRVRNVTFRRLDFWGHDISGYDAVVIYMTAKIRDRMAEKLQRELKPGALILINETHLPNRTPEAVFEVGVMKVKVVAYRQPAAPRAEG